MPNDDKIGGSVWLRTRASLIARLRGECAQSSWQEFYDMYWRAIYGYALRFGVEPDGAQDIVQEVFIKVFRQLPRFQYDRSRGRFLSWLKTITRTTVLDRVRRRQSRVDSRIQEQLSDGVESPIEQIPDSREQAVPDPWEEEWRRSLLSMALERVKKRVNEVTFRAFNLYALESKSVSEVAAELGISANVVYISKNRVLKHLKDEIAVLQSEV